MTCQVGEVLLAVVLWEILNALKKHLNIYHLCLDKWSESRICSWALVTEFFIFCIIKNVNVNMWNVLLALQLFISTHAVYQPDSDTELGKLDTEFHFFSSCDTTLRGSSTFFASMMQFHHVKKLVKQWGVPDSCFNDASVTSQTTKIHPNTRRFLFSITPQL